MNNLIIFSLLLLGLWGILFIISLSSKRESIKLLDFNHTNILKGYAIVAVLFGHVGQYSGVGGIEYPAGVGVSLFLILSGYRIAFSVKKNGLNKFWIKRFSRIFAPYIFAELIFFIAQGKDLSFTNIIMDFSFLKPLHPFGWYLHYILICYILFYIIWKIGETDKQRIVLLIVLFSTWFFIKSIIVIDEPFFLAARQMLAFPIGVFIGMKKLRAPEWSMKNIISLGLIVSSTTVYVLLHMPYLDNLPILLYNLFALGTCTVCALGIIGLTYSLKLLQNKGMVIIAGFSFEIYIVHGYFIDNLSNTGNVLGGVAKFIFYTAAGSILLKCLTDFIWKKKNMR